MFFFCMLDELDEDRYIYMPLASHILITTIYEKYIDAPIGIY
jgi:hypothetical protein